MNGGVDKVGYDRKWIGEDCKRLRQGTTLETLPCLPIFSRLGHDPPRRERCEGGPCRGPTEGAGETGQRP